MRKVLVLLTVLIAAFSLVGFSESSYVLLFEGDLIVLDSADSMPIYDNEEIILPILGFCQKANIPNEIGAKEVVIKKPSGKRISFAYEDMIKREERLYVTLSEFSKKMGIESSVNKKLFTMEWRDEVKAFEKKLLVEGKTIYVEGVKLHRDKDGYEVGLGVANNKVGEATLMENLIADNGALIAINGSYFDAYSGKPDPYGLLIKDGELIHNGANRGVIGFTDDSVLVERVNSEVRGHNDLTYKWKHQWLGTWHNHSQLTNGASINVYTSARGKYTGAEEGINYIVEDGIITKKVLNESVTIPENGMVINLYGELHEEIYSAFEVGRPSYLEQSYLVNGEVSDKWNDVNVAVGAGPLLLKNHELAIDFDQENFYEGKIVNQVAARSAIGVTEDNSIVMAVATCTINDLAKVMMELGCVDAINLDGGASSGLYVNGEWLRKPSRELSNILFFK